MYDVRAASLNREAIKSIRRQTTALEFALMVPDNCDPIDRFSWQPDALEIKAHCMAIMIAVGAIIDRVEGNSDAASLFATQMVER